MLVKVKDEKQYVVLTCFHRKVILKWHLRPSVQVCEAFDLPIKRCIKRHKPPL